jgi:hypothetical protein
VALGARAWNAKIIKLADLIDNTEDICRKDRHFAPVYLREKRLILSKMLEAEGTKIAELPIFREAKRITHLSG